MKWREQQISSTRIPYPKSLVNNNKQKKCEKWKEELTKRVSMSEAKKQQQQQQPKNKNKKNIYI